MLLSHKFGLSLAFSASLFTTLPTLAQATQTQPHLIQQKQQLQDLISVYQATSEHAVKVSETKDNETLVLLNGPLAAVKKLKAFMLNPPALHLKVKNNHSQWVDFGPASKMMLLPHSFDLKDNCNKLKAMGLKHIVAEENHTSLHIQLWFLNKNTRSVKSMVDRHTNADLGFFIKDDLMTGDPILSPISSSTVTLQDPDAKKIGYRDLISGKPSKLSFGSPSSDWAPVALHPNLLKANSENSRTFSEDSVCTTTDLIAVVKTTRLLVLLPHINSEWGLFFQDKKLFNLEPIPDQKLKRFISLASNQEKKRFLKYWGLKKSWPELRVITDES